MNENMNINQGMDNSYSNMNNNSMMDASLVNPDMMNQNFSDVMNDNNNSEIDEMLKKKIEKREKFDIILAYVLIGILLACIVIILVLKFSKKDEPVIEDNTPKYIGLNEIVDTLNNSNLVNNYKNNGVTFNSIVSGNSMVVTYSNNDTNLNLNIPMVGTELEVVIPTENSDLVTEIYKEITYGICLYYGNSEFNCRSTLTDYNPGDYVEGIRYNSGSNTVYIDTTNGIRVKESYSEVTKTSIDNSYYILDLADASISNINIDRSTTNIKFTGEIETFEEGSYKVVVKLYDGSDNLIKENKIDYAGNNKFEVNFVLDNELTLDKIVNYSIEIEK